MKFFPSFFAFAVVAAALCPVVGHAQMVFAVGVSVSPQDTTKPTTVVSVDSFANVKTFVKNNRPIVIIDGAVKPAAQFNKLKLPQIATLELKMEEDTNYYGPQAKNGVLVITLKPVPVINKNKKGKPVSDAGKVDDRTIRAVAVGRAVVLSTRI